MREKLYWKIEKHSFRFNYYVFLTSLHISQTNCLFGMKSEFGSTASMKETVLNTAQSFAMCERRTPISSLQRSRT